MKNDIAIKDDIYTALKNSALVAAVSGALYKTRRPLNSTKEDVVISVVSNMAETANQEAQFYVNVYVQDVKRKDYTEENSARLRTLARLADEALERYNGGDFRFIRVDQRVMPVQDINEHVISTRCRYYQNND